VAVDQRLPGSSGERVRFIWSIGQYGQVPHLSPGARLALAVQVQGGGGDRESLDRSGEGGPRSDVFAQQVRHGGGAEQGRLCEGKAAHGAELLLEL
jgi:hypothetical protein